MREQRNEMANRLTGKTRLSQAEKEALRQKKTRVKDKFEMNNLGDFQCLFPLKRGLRVEDDVAMDKYDMIYKRAKQVYEDSTT